MPGAGVSWIRLGQWIKAGAIALTLDKTPGYRRQAGGAQVPVANPNPSIAGASRAHNGQRYALASQARFKARAASGSGSAWHEAVKRTATQPDTQTGGCFYYRLPDTQCTVP
ncbi:MAG TPA: hypothetical protein VFQ82_02725 [Stellaceae bacterium]|nr:hypothetical protein [Stellaceae bacterium]